MSDEGSALDPQAFEKACAKLLIWAPFKLLVLTIICQPPKKLHTVLFIHSDSSFGSGALPVLRR